MGPIITTANQSFEVKINNTVVMTQEVLANETFHDSKHEARFQFLHEGTYNLSFHQIGEPQGFNGIIISNIEIKINRFFFFPYSQQ